MGDVEVRTRDSIDLEIGEYEFSCVLGGSGLGKSTLMNIIGCLDTPRERKKRTKADLEKVDLSGYYPAIRAAKLVPHEALLYE